MEGFTSAHGIEIPKEKIAVFCRKHHINELSQFGSVLRDDFRPDSDLDFLVSFKKDHIPGLLKLVSMERGLSLLFNGRKIDIRTVNDLSRYFRNEVINKREVVYIET
jgi:uncharacterized protein